jgi:hypothetical protein
LAEARAQRRRFARTIGPKEAVNGSARHGEIDVVEDGRIATEAMAEL